MPVLKIVPLDSIIIHEHHDRRRSEKLAIVIKADGVLKDPPIVARLGGKGERYVHLDGANRIDTLKLLGCRDILVQVVDYYDEEQVRLDSWCHLTRMDKDLLLRQLGSVQGAKVRKADHLSVTELLRRRKALCGIFFSDGDSYAVEGGNGLASRVELLNKVVDIYKAEIARDVLELGELTSQIGALFRRHSHEGYNVLIAFPKFTPKEIVEIAERGMKLPAGITRHLITNRALRVNFPLMILDSKKIPLEEKNALLDDFLRRKSPRLYKESTVMYDE